MSQRIEVTLDEIGNAQVEVIGCAGPSCKSLTEGIEKALGKTVQDVNKPEIHRQTQVQQQKSRQ